MEAEGFRDLAYAVQLGMHGRKKDFEALRNLGQKSEAKPISAKNFLRQRPKHKGRK